MLNIFNTVLWSVVTIIILAIGLFFTKNLNFVQFRFKEIVKSFKKSNLTSGISSFSTLLIALSGRIGIGSLSGMALAIYIGGPGTIFWMWVSTIIISVNAFAESVLAVNYHEKDYDGNYKGGPSYYIEKGLGKKKMAKLYAILILISYIGGFLTIQVNTIAKSVTQIVIVDKLIIGVVIALISGLIISKGIKSIAKVSNFLVPIMCIFYSAACIYILVINYDLLPVIFVKIISSAFNFKTIGVSVIIIGIQRGIFSNEAGIGSGAIASGATDTNNATSQGLAQVLGVYITSLLICTITALVILTTNYTSLNIIDVNGIEITMFAFANYFGMYGKILIIIVIILFAFSTIIAGYYYGESSLKYIFRKIKPVQVKIFKIIVLGILILGSISKSSLLWNIVDILVAVLAIINIYALFGLRKEVVEEWKNYQYMKKSGKMK